MKIDKRLPLKGPVYKHDCDACIFLGHYEEHDLYVCPNKSDVDGGTVIARYSGDGPDYASGMTFGEFVLGSKKVSDSVRYLRIAYLIAADLGYVPFSWGGMKVAPQECTHGVGVDDV